MEGVSEEWGRLMDPELLRRVFESEAPTPSINPAFESLRYGTPSDINTVIIGGAGLCFSNLADVTPSETLMQIFGCLSRAGLCCERDNIAGDLRPWAVQGVLMIDESLAAQRVSTEVWKPFFNDFLRRFCASRAEAGACIHFLLWGVGAQGFAEIAHQHSVYKWSHPEKKSFRDCPHFEEVNAALTAAGRRPITWDNLSPVIAFSDGSCPRNGKPGARASFAAIVTGAQFGATILRGEVSPTEYAFIDDDNPERGIRGTPARPVAPSNNRGELLGIIYAFLALLRGRALGRVELVSDSEISINTLEIWLPARLKKKTSRDLKNYDLVMIAWRLLELLRVQAATVILTHTRSHQKPPPASAPSRERFIWKGNDMADRHADVPLAAPLTTSSYAVEVIASPAILQEFACG